MFAKIRFLVPWWTSAIAVALAVLAPSAHAVAPAAPTGVKVDMTRAIDADTAASAGIAYDSSASYLIRWTDNAFDEEGYKVEARIGNAGPFSTLQYLRADSNSCVAILSIFPKDTQIQFLVSAYKYNGSKVEYSRSAVFPYIVPEVTPSFAPPSNFTAEMVGDGTVKLKWTDNSTTEIYHQVLYKKHADSTYTSLGFVYFNITEVSMQLGLVPGQAYDLEVRATRKAPSDGTSFGGSEHVTNVAGPVTVTIPALLAPTGLSGTVKSETSVQLSWTDNSTNETGYKVEYRQLGDTDFTSLGTISANSKTVTVPTPPNTTVEWRVRAIYTPTDGSTVIESEPTAPTIQLSTAFAAPANLVAATSPTAGSVDLTWEDNSASESGYEILTRPSTTGADFTVAATLPANTTSATVSSRLTSDGTSTVPLEINEAHEFKVRAYYGSVNSGETNIATAMARQGFTSRFYNPATVGVAYNGTTQYQLAVSATVTVTDGVKNWNIADLGSVGMAFDNTTGIVSGTPTKPGVFTFPMSATFSDGWTAHGTLTLRILRPRASVTSEEIADTTIATNSVFNIPLASKFFDPESEQAVRMETTKGNIDILLYPSLAPEAVANFLSYVKAGDYDGSVFHRSIPGFVIQGGGYRAINTPNVYSSVTARPSPKNEPGISNVMGTIASAKVGGNPNSATHDFFLNLADNNSSDPQSLDNQNGGFTAFGRVATAFETRTFTLSNDFPVLAGIAALPRGNYVDYNQEGSDYDSSLDKRVVIDGSSASFTDWPMNSTGSAPANMDVYQNIFINAAYEIPVMTYTVLGNSVSDVVSATIVDGNLQLKGLKAGQSVITVKGTDLEQSSSQRNFTVTVTPNYKAPVITKHPVSLALTAGAKGTFTVTATGTALSYQWRKADGSGNFVAINGQTGKSLVLNNVQAGDVGSYDVQVTNATTTVTSNPARLDFKTGPAFTSDPNPKVVNVGEPLELEVSVTGAPVPTIAWLRGAATVGGQKNSKLSIAKAKLTDGGVYSAKATNTSGKLVSAGANVYVVDPTTVVTTLKPGGKATLKAAFGGPALGYQWLKNGVVLNDSIDGRIKGTETATLIISNATYTDSDSYTCRVTVPDSNLSPVVTGVQKVAVVVRPVISNYTAAVGVVGYDYDFSIPYDTTITNTPTKFTLGNLPPGLKYDNKTGHITGRPIKAGRYLVGTIIGNIVGNSTTAIGTFDILPMSQYGVGTFVGAIEPSSLNNNKGGRLDLTTMDTGTFSGKLLLGSDSYTIAGAITYVPGVLAPSAQIVVKRKGKTPLILVFSINESIGSVSGQLTDGLTVSQVSGFRQFWQAEWNPSGFFSGSYTAAINLDSTDVGNVALPQGSGYAVVTATLGGTVLTTLRLPDGTSVTCSSIVGPSGQFLIYQTLYRNTGSVLSAPSFGTRNLGSGNQKIVRLSGDFRWIKDAQTSASERNYKSGFGPLDMTLLGRTYTAPASGTRIMGLPASSQNATVDFSQGGLPAAAINPDVQITIPTTNVAQLPAAGSAGNPANVKLSLSTGAGTYTGSFQLVDGTTKRTVNYLGVIVPAIPTTPAIAATETTAAVAEIPGTDPQAVGYFLLNQLGSAGPPVTTPSNSPILSGKVVIAPKAIVINSLTTNPSTLTVNPGATNYAFTVSATGDGTLSYQWRRNGANIPGATGTTYTIATVAEANEGNYDVIVTNGSTSTTSTAVAFSVNDPVGTIGITKSPSTSVTASGSTVTLTAAPQGTAPFTYQWYKDGGEISGATAATYTIDSADAATHNGSYSVKVFNIVTTAGKTSGTVALNIQNGVSNVVASRTPSGSTVSPGQSVTFQVTADGSGSLTYQWRKGGENISGATASSYTISPVAAEDSGMYDVVVYNAATPSGVASNQVGLDVSEAISSVTISRDPDDSAVAVGQLVTLSVSAVNGSGPYGYQWRKNGDDIQGATSATYSFTAYMEDNANFDVVVTNEFTPAGVNSNVVSLVVAEPIADVIASISPTSNVTPGTSVTFSVSATGTGPYFYQWRKGGIEIQFATSATYNIPSVAESDSGDYDVVVSNAVGSVTSAAVPLSVTP